MDEVHDFELQSQDRDSSDQNGYLQCTSLAFDGCKNGDTAFEGDEFAFSMDCELQGI